MTKFRVGIIGLGGMGRTMLADMQTHQDYTVTRIWDPDPEVCARVNSAYPDIIISDDAASLIAGAEVNLVYVASPPKSHREYYLKAIDAGTSMFCEKPFGVEVAESDDLVRQLKAKNFPSLINFNHGNALGSTHIERELKADAIGEVKGADVYIHLTTWPRDFQAAATWLGNREQGGFTREMISHWLYLTRRLFGDGRIVSAKIDYPDDGISAETHLTAELDFGGVSLFIRVATGGVGPVGTEYTIWGSKKSYRLHSGGRVSYSDGANWTELFTDLSDIGASDRQRTLDGVSAYFAGEEINMPSADDAFAVQKLVESILANGRNNG